MKCPETIEELEALERHLDFCRAERAGIYDIAQAKINSGVAHGWKEAERQISEETGRPETTIRQARIREQRDRGVTRSPLCENEIQAGRPEDEATKDADKSVPICLLHTGDQESYTPAKYIEAAREVMGSIDLDPASNDLAQKTVQAATHYTKEDNGLDKPWAGAGNIFLNPPYSHPEVKYFVDKLLRELTQGQQAILLTNNNTDTNFFQDAARQAAAVCFTKGRINFLKSDGSISSPTNGQAFFYFGAHKSKFIEIFSSFGLVMEAS